MPEPSATALERAFRGIRLFKELPDSLCAKLLPFASLRRVRRGESVFLQGEPSPYCFGVLSGRIEIQSASKNGQGPVKLLGEVEAGEFFGESALFADTPRSATARAAEDGELLVLRGTAWRGWMAQEPASALPLVMSILQGSLERLHQTSQELAVIYGMERLLAAPQPFKDNLRSALSFLRGSLDNVEALSFYERNPYWSEFTAFDEEKAALPATHAFVQRMRETAAATFLSRLDADAWKLQDIFPGKSPLTGLVVPLLDPEAQPPGLEGFLIAISETRTEAFSADTQRLFSALAHPLSEALLRERRQADRDARTRLQQPRF